MLINNKTIIQIQIWLKTSFPDQMLNQNKKHNLIIRNSNGSNNNLKWDPPPHHGFIKSIHQYLALDMFQTKNREDLKKNFNGGKINKANMKPNKDRRAILTLHKM